MLQVYLNRKTGVILGSLLAVLLIFGLPQKAQAQGKKQVVQLSGLVTVGDSLFGMLGASVYVPKAGRGGFTNQYGYFSLAVLAGDSVVFSALGFKSQFIIIPKNYAQQSYSVIIEMKEDPKILPEVRIFPYSTEELFKRAFLSLKLPSNNDKVVARNLNEAIIERMLLDVPMSPNANFRYTMHTENLELQRKYLYPTIPLTAWKDLIDAIKRGDFNNSKYKKESGTE